MARILLSFGCIMAMMCQLLMGAVAVAQTPATVRLSLIQATGADVKYERIDITNYGDQATDVTGWRLVYKSASGATTTPLVQITAATNWHVLIEPGLTESVLSKELVGSTPVGSPLRQAMQFSAALNHTAGSLQLLDAGGQVIDMVGWGATAAEIVRQGDAAPAMSVSTWLKRRAVTGNNATDFSLESQAAAYPATVGSLQEVLDVCTNIDGLQRVIPDGYVGTPEGACQPVDACPNLPGMQSIVPDGQELTSTGECVAIDLCQNIEGIQERLPDGYEATGPRQCEPVLPARAVKITELLPNPSGADAGNEFIELYNADREPVDLDNYVLVIGAKTYKFPASTVIAPATYWTVSDAELGVSLPNTTGVPLYLMTIRGVEVAAAPAYKNAADDVAWALVDGMWHYTYASTPGAANILADEPPCQPGYARDDVSRRCRKPSMVVPSAPAPCAEGQYRSEATGRCRTTIRAGTLTPCKEGQYRSEETNRCRSFAVVATAKPCADDQFRNPLTNRCKSIASSDDAVLSDCGEGRERNPDTHRCRNVVSASVPAATFAVVPVKEAAKGFAGWWVLGGVGVLAAGYGAWEWRREAAAIFRRVAARFAQK